MTRPIPIVLQAHMDRVGTTLCYLLRIQARNGTVIAVTSTDRDIDFDDGGGEVTYSASLGLNQSSLQSSAGLDVDNAEATLLIVDSSDFTDQQINAGVLDFARFNVYRVNWVRLSDGYFNVVSGTTGTITSLDGLAGRLELRGMSQVLKQNFIELYSLTCRAAFGSVGRFGCHFDAAPLWDAGTVQSVDSGEPDRIFQAVTPPSASGPNGALGFAPGLVHFLTGNNAGGTWEIEDVAGGQITLRFPTPYDILATDTYEARPDCAKRYLEDCIGAYDNKLNFRGEPWIVQGDEASGQMPGASAPVVTFSISNPPPPIP